MIDDQGLLESARRLSEALAPGDLDATLTQLTAAAVDLIPEVVYASITVRHGDDRLETVGPTHPALIELDKAQYTFHEGPCYDAATDETHVVSTNLSEDPRFMKYGPVAVEAGIRAQAAFRLFDSRESQGALNLYATEVGAFEDLGGTAALFKHQAAVAISYAREVTNLKEALATRKTIGQAMGIVMERYQLTDDRAFAFLTRLSQQRNVKLRLVAQELIAASDERGNEERDDEEPSAPQDAAG